MYFIKYPKLTIIFCCICYPSSMEQKYCEIGILLSHKLVDPERIHQAKIKTETMTSPFGQMLKVLPTFF